MRGVGLACVGVLIIVGAEGRSDACSPPTETRLYGRSLFPSDGASGVPTNAVVFYSLRGWSLDRQADDARTQDLSLLDDVRLRQKGGDEVETQVDAVESFRWNDLKIRELRPTSPLKANTQYEILDHVPTPNCSPNCVVPELVVAATFTTGNGPDTQAPAAPTPGTESREKIVCESSSCCGPFVGWTHISSWQPVADDRVGYRIRTAAGASMGVIHFEDLRVFGLCDGPYRGPIGPHTFLYATPPLTVHAIDQAGNESAGLTIGADFSCVDSVADAAPAAPPDAAPAAPPAAPPDAPPAVQQTGSGGSCSVGGGAATIGAFLALLALSAVGKRLRGRRRQGA